MTPATPKTSAAPATIPIYALVGDPAFLALSCVPGIAVDLRYASTRKLPGQDLHSPHDCAWLHAEAASALRASAQWLEQQHPSLRLCVLDAARPHRVQERFWSHVRGTATERYFADPTRRSNHSFGLAVDLTLLDAQGHEPDMCSAFDDTTERFHPALEGQLLLEGCLKPEHLKHRTILRSAMQHVGRQGIDTEWWDFNFGDPEAILASYLLIV